MLGQVKQSESLHIRLWPENAAAIKRLRTGTDKKLSLSHYVNGLLYTMFYKGTKRTRRA